MSGCPDPDMLIAAGEGVLPEKLERAIQFHLDSCRTCAMLRCELTEFALAEPTLDEITRVRQRVRARMRQDKRAGVKHAAVAAGIAIALILPLGSKQPKPVPPVHDRAVERSVPAANSPTSTGCLPPVAKAPLRLPLATALVTRGARDADEQRYLRELGRALAPYRANDFQQASARLARLASRYPPRVEPVFYLGVARLIGGDPAAAVEALEAAKKIGSEELRDDIAAYLSAARRTSACTLAGQ